MLQTTVAIVAIAALVGLWVSLSPYSQEKLVAHKNNRIVMHHRQEGQLLTQDQEEYILIGGLALTWVGA